MTMRTLGSADTYVRAKRIDLKRPVPVEAKTLGTLIHYKLLMENFSRSGLFLTSDKPRHVPYQINTLVELTVDPAAEVLSQPLYCLGKVVRTGGTGTSSPQFGVQLIMMESRDEAEWQRVIDTLSADVLSLPAAV